MSNEHIRVIKYNGDNVIAVQWSGNNIEETRLIADTYLNKSEGPLVFSEEGEWHSCLKGDWIIRTSYETFVMSDKQFQQNHNEYIEMSKEREEAIIILRKAVYQEHAASAWGFSGVGFWLGKALDHIENFKREL